MSTSPLRMMRKIPPTANLVIDKWLEDIRLNEKTGDKIKLGLGITIDTNKLEENGNTLQPSLTGFTIFPNLPSELRIKIWRFSIPGPRIVAISRGSCKDKEKCIGRGKPKVCVTHRPMAERRNINEFSAAQTNRESRQELLRTHRFSFAGDLKYPIYFDFKKDTLFFDSEGALQQFDDITRFLGSENRAMRLYSNLRHVMVAMDGDHLGGFTDAILGKMLNLESMRIVVSLLCQRSITSMGLESERALHEAYLQVYWCKNGAEEFPTVTLHSLTTDASGDLVVGEPQDGSWGCGLGYRASRRLVFDGDE
ncbi:hypothetical protein V8E51_009747 [Hyaloscypha variabilis]